MNKLNVEIAEEVGKTVGTVVSTQFKNDMMGVTLCVSEFELMFQNHSIGVAKLFFEDGKEGWVAFKYEKLPNFCYWCGLVSHDDKDCECWLSSKGTLSIKS